MRLSRKSLQMRLSLLRAVGLNRRLAGYKPSMNTGGVL
jgi:hypothetical protein